MDYGAEGLKSSLSAGQQLLSVPCHMSFFMTQLTVWQLAFFRASKQESSPKIKATVFF